MSETNPHSLKTTNEAANLLALLLNQEGWVKGVDELITAGDLLLRLPEERPANVENWDKQPFSEELTTKETKAVKHCITALAEKGNLVANPVTLQLLASLGYDIPSTEAKIKISLPQIAAKYLADLFVMQGKLKKVEDLITGCQIHALLPRLTEKMAKDDSASGVALLKEWMRTPLEITITDRQKDLCRTVLKSVADDGTIRASRYIPVLYTEFGLRE